MSQQESFKPSADDLAAASLKKVGGPAAGVSGSILEAARADLEAKAALKDARHNTAALAAVTPHDALSKVETRGEGLSAAVIQAAKEDRELKKNLPLEAAHGVGSLKKVEGVAPNTGVSESMLEAARQDLSIKAALKDTRQSTAALAAVTPHDALSKVETRGEGLSAAVIQAAREDRELKKSVPRTAAVMAGSESHLRHVDGVPSGEGLSAALKEAAKADLQEKRAVLDHRNAAISAISQGVANLTHREAPVVGLSQGVLEAAKADRELKSSLPKEAAAAAAAAGLKHVEVVQGEGVGAATLAAAKEDFEATAQVAKAKKAVNAGLADALGNLKHVEAPSGGLSQTIVDAVRADAEANARLSDTVSQNRKIVAAELASHASLNSKE